MWAVSRENTGTTKHMLVKFRPLMATAAKARAPAAVAASTAAAAERDEHVHYKHTDACHHLRWTAK